MNLAGYSKYTQLHEVTDPLRSEILKRCESYLVENSPKALIQLLGVLFDPARPGAQNQLKAIDMILNRAGLSKEELLESKSNQKIVNNIVILPEKRDPGKIVIDGEIVETTE